MIAPKEIYVHRTVHLGLLSASEIDVTGNDVKYIRKDVLIDLLQAELAEAARYSQGAANGIRSVIDKVKTM